MRILHILDHSLPHQSGYVYRTLGILQAQRERGWATLQLTSAKQGGNMQQRKGAGLHFFRTPALAGPLWRLPLMKQLAVVYGLVRRLSKLAGRVRPDILHAHSPALNGLAALYVGRRLGLPVVYEVRAFWEDAAGDRPQGSRRGARYWLSRMLENFVLRRASAITTICAGLRQDLLIRGYAATRITVVPNAVNFPASAPSLAPASIALGPLDAGSAPLLLGYAGSYYAYEGLDLLISVMPALLARHPALQLHCAGGGPQEAYLRSLVQQLHLQQHVTFLGRLPQTQVHQLYRRAQVMVYPRRSMRLTELVTPLKPLEAMAHGSLVLASDVGGHKELITDGITGTLFRAGDGADLVRTLARLLARPGHWQFLRDNALRQVCAERNWQHSVAAYEPVYRSLLK